MLCLVFGLSKEISENRFKVSTADPDQGRSVVFQFRYAQEGVVKQAPIEGASF